MNPMKKSLAAIGLATLLIAGAGTALAFGGPKGHHGCDRDGGHSPLTALTRLDDLTDEQKNQLRVIRKSARDAMRDLRDEMRDNREDLHEAMVDSADLEAIRALAGRQGEQVARMIVLRAEIREKIAHVLSEDQREQLRDLRGSGKGFGDHSSGMRF